MHYSPTAQAIALLDTTEDPGSKIRADFRQLKGVQLGKYYPIESTWNGKKSSFFVAQLKLSNGNKPAKLHIRQIKPGRVMVGDPTTYNMYGYEITADNELVSKGFLHVATDQELKDWRNAGFPLPKMQE